MERPRTSSTRRLRRLPLLLVIALVGCLGAATSAHADVDPAGAALAYQDVYVPMGQPVRGDVIGELHALAAAARQAHHPVKVALIASPADLDVLGRFFGRPSAYARFLSSELSYAFSGDVLVAMPNGLGMFDVGGIAHNTLAGIRIERRAGASGLAAAATIALRRLAAGTSGASPASGSDDAEQITLVGAAAFAGALPLLLMFRTRRRARAGRLLAPNGGRLS